jgi:hypothetical protein
MARGGFILAAISMIVLGAWEILTGIGAIADKAFLLVNNDYTYRINTTGWGWIHLILGALVALAGFSLFSGATWARAVGIFLAVLVAVNAFLFLPYYPLASIALMALAFFAIWSLTTGGSRMGTGDSGTGDGTAALGRHDAEARHGLDSRYDDDARSANWSNEAGRRAVQESGAGRGRMADANVGGRGMESEHSVGRGAVSSSDSDYGRGTMSGGTSSSGSMSGGTSSGGSYSGGSMSGGTYSGGTSSGGSMSSGTMPDNGASHRAMPDNATNRGGMTDKARGMTDKPRGMTDKASNWASGVSEKGRGMSSEASVTRATTDDANVTRVTTDRDYGSETSGYGRSTVSDSDAGSRAIPEKGYGRDDIQEEAVRRLKSGQRKIR